MQIPRMGIPLAKASFKAESKPRFFKTSMAAPAWPTPGNMTRLGFTNNLRVGDDLTGKGEDLQGPFDGGQVSGLVIDYGDHFN